MSVRERIFAQSPLRFVRLGLTREPYGNTFLDCRPSDGYHVFDRHEKHGIAVRPRLCSVEGWWEAFYRMGNGELVLTGLANGCPMDRPPQRIPVRNVWPAGSMGFGPYLEQVIIDYLLCDSPDGFKTEEPRASKPAPVGG